MVTAIFQVDLRAIILDLLSDHDIFGNLDNLVVNSVLEESLNILASTWHGLPLYFFQPEIEFPLLPIIMYVDKTGASDHKNYGLEP